MKTIKEYIADRFYNAANARLTDITERAYIDAENLVTRLIEQADKAGCPLVSTLEEFFGSNNTVCRCSREDAETIADAIVNYSGARLYAEIIHPVTGRKRYSYCTVDEFDAVRILGIAKLI